LGDLLNLRSRIKAEIGLEESGDFAKKRHMHFATHKGVG
jgi:hypothetical protein